MEDMEFFSTPVGKEKACVDPEALTRLKMVASSDFARCPYTKAIEILKKAVADGEPTRYRQLSQLSLSPLWLLSALCSLVDRSSRPPLRFACVDISRLIGGGAVCSLFVRPGHIFDPKDTKGEKQVIEWGIDMASEHERYLCEVRACISLQLVSLFRSCGKHRLPSPTEWA